MSAELVSVPVPGTDRQIMASVIDSKPMVSVRHACDAIGIDFSRQLRKLREKSWAGVVMMSTPSAGGDQQTAMIDRRTFTMWLATIDTNRVSAAVRPIVVAFQSEASDALDAYFNEGAAINPRAATDQVDAAIRKAQLIAAFAGVIDPKHLEAKARIELARGLGEVPELEASSTPLYVWDYLESKHLTRTLIEAKASGFGKRLKKAYIAKRGVEPKQYPQNTSCGRVRWVNAYSEGDRSLFDQVWAQFYAERVSGDARGELF